MAQIDVSFDRIRWSFFLLTVGLQGNIGVILFAVHEFDTALRFLQSSEAVMTANGEPKRLKVGYWP